MNSKYVPAIMEGIAQLKAQNRIPREIHMTTEQFEELAAELPHATKDIRNTFARIDIVLNDDDEAWPLDASPF